MTETERKKLITAAMQLPACEIAAKLASRALEDLGRLVVANNNRVRVEKQIQRLKLGR